MADNPAAGSRNSASAETAADSLNSTSAETAADSGTAVERLGGADRYATAAAIVSKAFPSGADTVILTSGEDWPDAVVSSALAGAKNCPILLTEKDRLTEQTSDLIDKLHAKNAVLSGGTGALSDTIKAALISNGMKEENIIRIGGDSRSQTAEKIGREVMTSGGTDTCFICPGTDFPDALSVSSYAYANKTPILLAQEDGTLSADTLAMAESFKKIYLIGGEAVLSSQAETQLAGCSPIRLAGSDRYLTNAKIIHTLYGDSLPCLAVANGNRFPDALVGSSLEGKDGGAVLFVDNSLSSVSDMQLSILVSSENAAVLGGEDAVSAPLKTAVEKSFISYGNSSLWAYSAVGEGKDVDLFLIAPTADMGRAGNMNMSLEDTKTMSKFLGALNMERGIYSDTCRMYAPYYRQVTGAALTTAEEQYYYRTAYADVKNAFLYYMEHENNGRPFILAGFSQGAELCISLMKDLFRDGAYADQLVETYAIGWRLTEEETSAYPQLKLASGEKDTGSIVIFDAEAAEVTNPFIIPEGTKSLSINPLNWKTDSTPADKSLNLGACFTDYSGSIKKETAGLCGACIDPERGSLKVTDVTPEEYPAALAFLGNGSYHIYDYQFFYRNLQKNTADRAAAYSSAALKNAA
jgi:putative cell wall-binding protein